MCYPCVQVFNQCATIKKQNERKEPIGVYYDHERERVNYPPLDPSQEIIELPSHPGSITGRRSIKSTSQKKNFLSST